uniref:Uncharacterized protein n=1 Tax=Caenorhabditis japonica TaxID=281687 RepID=A0A8R1IFX8_CAEJA
MFTAPRHLETGHLETATSRNRDISKPDISKPDISKPDISKPRHLETASTGGGWNVLKNLHAHEGMPTKYQKTK